MKPNEYADGEMQYMPEHFDEQTKLLVRFMIQEAFQAGQNQIGRNKNLLPPVIMSIEESEEFMEGILPDFMDEGTISSVTYQKDAENMEILEITTTDSVVMTIRIPGSVRENKER